MKDQINKLLSDGKTVIVDFYAEWCAPCKALAPSLEDIATADDNVELVKIDIEENMELAQEFGVRSVPTIHFLKGDKKEVAVGNISKNKIEEALKIIQ